MRVVLSVDMEGISQLEDPQEIITFARPYWEAGRRRMTADAVAAAEGVLAGGADEVIVLDNHASGNPQNLLDEELPDGARVETWDVFDLGEHGVDAMLQVGYHARAGVEAFISHTYVPGLRLRVNGEPVSESHGRAWAAGVPLLGIVGNEQHARTLGSWIVTADELGDPHDLGIRAFVNDELRQNSNTGEMICNCFQQVSHLSEAFTLEPGDVIAAGTPAGVGAARQPFPEGLLKVGDVVRIEIDGIGALENTVIEEPDGYLAPHVEFALPFGD